MAIHLSTDFGLEGPYTGQVLARLYAEAPKIPAFSLFADAPAFDARLSAYLVAAYGKDAAAGDVLLCVVDPGVGTDRAGLALNADGRWFVGPDNGLLDIAARQAREARWWRLDGPPMEVSATFHGRDWFAPAAAFVARTGEVPGVRCDGPSGVSAEWPADLPEIVYIDRYGNAMTGLRADGVAPECRFEVCGTRVDPGRVFASAPAGAPLWYRNANGLVEIAVNRGRADRLPGLALGTRVTYAAI
ncbi:MAG: SAM-dependent chlorinase/fluorinase [Acidihalobacter sp.]